MQNNPGLLTIKQASVWTSNHLHKKKETYFVDFEFVCGKYQQNFGKIFFARDEKILEKKIHNYLKNYYGKKCLTEITDDVYYFYDGEVGVKCVGWREVKSFKELVSKLL